MPPSHAIRASGYRPGPRAGRPGAFVHICAYAPQLARAMQGLSHKPMRQIRGMGNRTVAIIVIRGTDPRDQKQYKFSPPIKPELHK